MSAPDRFSDEIGAYLLGALEAAESDAFEEHLAGCQACRREVAKLSVARDALPRSVDQVMPPERLKANLLGQVRAEAGKDTAPAPATPRRSRWRELLLARPAFAAAAAALVVAIGIGLGALTGTIGGGEDGEGENARTLSAVVDQTRMPTGKAQLVLHAQGKEGGSLHVEGMQPPQAGKVYEVWVKRGERVKASSLFTVDRDGAGTAAIPGNLRGVDAVMITREPVGGSKTPSEPPLVTVPLSS